jgi:hypothetical protein
MGGCGVVAVDVMMEVSYLRYSVAISLNNAAQATEHRTYRDVTQDLQSGLDRFPGVFGLSVADATCHR